MDLIDETSLVLFPVFDKATGQTVFRQVAAMREEESIIEYEKLTLFLEAPEHSKIPLVVE